MSSDCKHNLYRFGNNKPSDQETVLKLGENDKNYIFNLTPPPTFVEIIMKCTMKRHISE